MRMDLTHDFNLRLALSYVIRLRCLESVLIGSDSEAINVINK